MKPSPFLLSIFTSFFLFSSCIRLAPPKQTTIKATSTVHLESKSSNWLFARGDQGMGVSSESNLPDELNSSALWTYDIQGGGIPVIAGNKVYQFGYYGSGEQVEESLTCLDIESGKLIWDKRRQDFISDIVYDRYGVGAACVDQESGNVFFQTSPGLLAGFSPDGSLLWERSLMEEFARLTFPNGRTGGPAWMKAWLSSMQLLPIGVRMVLLETDFMHLIKIRVNWFGLQRQELHLKTVRSPLWCLRI